MDVIFDIDGTLANAEHRLHLIKDPTFFVQRVDEKNGARTRTIYLPDWGTFLSDEMVAKDTPIPETWAILTALLYSEHARIMFITGRPEAQRKTTWDWLMERTCEHRAQAWSYWQDHVTNRPILYMRKDGDRRPSHVVKEERLHYAKTCGFRPTIVFEDRKDDAAMWRRNGLLCCQVAEGDY